MDIEKTTIKMEPDQSSNGGLYVPGKERVEFRAPQRKSLLGMR